MSGEYTTSVRPIPLDAECARCFHRKAEHMREGCAVRQMYGGRYFCECERFEEHDGEIRTEAVCDSWRTR